MDNAQPVRFFKRGYPPFVRFAFFALLSLVLLVVDVRFRTLDTVRYGLSLLVQPVQRVLSLPFASLHDAREYFYTQSSLIRHSEELQRLHDNDRVQLMQLQAIEAENQQLRKLLEIKNHVEFRSQLAEIIYDEKDVFRRRIFLDKGTQADVQAGQVVMDDNGIVGQVTRVYPLMSEVTLVTDKDQAVPVEVLRNGLRTVLFGFGDINHLAVRYTPVSADIQENDLLMTSGIDGTYPPGLPVARVTKIERDATYPFARILCTPVAGVDQHRQLLILSGQAKLPPAPEPASDEPALGKRKVKKP
ncbi:Cell shape-determining protein MreC [Ferriphaselus amnicola]|uniref:Cell shape-determining protein MreC n=1 Tax=Ferriphaselus amnicola TaxID=1188319 RepID=A0A2Z6GFQ7_9PROT|nr:rod shape-determining protein MreC [Ferriphaselus amnicola]BBE52249.1 Cell shape-determining protein MreC [Ferriphaselus amnicola]